MKRKTRKNEAEKGENSVRRTRARALSQTGILVLFSRLTNSPEMPGPSGLSKKKLNLSPPGQRKRGRGRPRKLEDEAAKT